MIFSQVKKGNPRDVLLECDSHLENCELLKTFILDAEKERIAIDKTILASPFLLNVYLNRKDTNKKPKPPTKKKQEAAEVQKLKKSKSQSSADDILKNLLNKYNSDPAGESKEAPTLGQGVKKNPQRENNVAEGENNDEDLFELRMCILYLDNDGFQTFKSLENLNVLLTSISFENPADVKKVLILESVRSGFEAKVMRKKIFQSQNPHAFQELGFKKRAFSQGFAGESVFGSQRSFDEDADNEEQDIFENTDDKFNEWLVGVNLEFNFDYILTESQRESRDLLPMYLASCINSKYKKNLGPFDTRLGGHSDKSRLAGFESEYALLWIDMLMTIPGISEEKAWAIAKRFPTIKSLLNSYLDQDNIKERERMLKDLVVVYNFDESRKRNLGKALSEKIYRLFTSTNPKQCVNE